MNKSSTQPYRVNARKRQGRCYELAGQGILNTTSNDSVLLCHGLVTNLDGTTIDHAWLEVDEGQIYDPVLDKVISLRMYSLRVAKVIMRYTKLEAAKLMTKTSHWGPWEPWEIET